MVKLRQCPLVISIVGGLFFVRGVTLCATPGVYLYLDHFQLWCQRVFSKYTPEAVRSTDAIGDTA